VRITTTKRGSNTYRSVQVVQSYRRDDGMPATRVLASFGNLPPLATENLKRAVTASREGKAVMVAPAATSLAPVAKVKRNLAYLDVAACLRTWQQWRLSELIDELVPTRPRQVSVSAVVAALTVQRCAAPASKLEDGDADQVTPAELQRIAQLPPQQQPGAFEQACAAAQGKPRLPASHKLAKLVAPPPLRVRAVAMFNPGRFVEQRQAALHAVDAVEAVLAAVNQALRAPRARTTRERAIGKVGHSLRERSLTDVFEIVVEREQLDGRVVPQLRLQRNDKKWWQRRQTDGITLIVSHPDVLEPPAQLVALYFAKDQVEKDFQSIKSVLALRPVHHHTDPKVRAHVSLCMLALLLERTIEERLRSGGIPMTAEAALHTLRRVHLNLFAGDAGLYSVTELDPDQQRILAALRLEELGNDAWVSDTLTPR
jgi:hypothetical protein